MKDDKILVEIAAYCDPDLLNTVQSAIVQAENPRRVHFAICYQSDNLEDLEKLKQIENCKIKHLKKAEAKGPCLARNICQKMIEDEKYIFQIDSHMRFCKHWDSKLIEQLLSIKDPKATISFYPASMSIEMQALPCDDKVFDLPSTTTPIIDFPRRFRNQNSYYMELASSTFEDYKDKNIARSPFIAAGNFFSFAEAHKEVLHDPNMFFAGDELPMSIRYFTHGWNNYCPNKSYIYHKYHRVNRELPSNGEKRTNEERSRLAQLINPKPDGPDLGIYGLGKQRTLQEFEEFSGVNFKERMIYMNGNTGRYDDESLRNKVSYLQRQLQDKYNFLAKEETIQVIIIDLSSEYEECAKSCIESLEKNKVEIIIGTTDEIIKNNTMDNKKIISFEKNTSYSVILSELINHTDDNYTLIIDSNVRFMKGWDKELCDSIKQCGDDAVLTSWTIQIPKSKEPVKTVPYLNATIEFDKFYNYLPVYKPRNSKIFHGRKNPLRTQFISNGFLFCHSKILKQIKPDPNLSYKEHNYIYAARLWTNGIDIYYPKNSYFYRTTKDELLDNGKRNLKVINGLMGRFTYQGKLLEENYPYRLGTKRPLWSWYETIGYDYTKEQLLRFV